MSKEEKPTPSSSGLFDRVVSILEEARNNVVRSVNSNMVIAYWLIGREIVEGVQEGEERAEYGKQILEDLSRKLNEKYGSGFSVTNLQSFRRFYLTYDERLTIQHPAGAKSLTTEKQAIQHPPGAELMPDAHAWGDEFQQRSPVGSEWAQMFDPHLSWSHYRAIMRVADAEARMFYEKEASECGWTKAQLERQIQSSCYERILKNEGKDALCAADRERLPGESLEPVHLLKSKKNANSSKPSGRRRNERQTNHPRHPQRTGRPQRGSRHPRGEDLGEL